MTQTCGKIPYEEELGFISTVILETFERYGNIWKGDLGEQVATEYAVNELDLKVQNFDKRVHGFDGVFRDGNGKLVILESKATLQSGLNALSDTNHGKEGSVEWVEYKATLMCDPTSTFFTEANAKIGEEILRVGAKNVEFIVVHTNPNSLQTDVTKLR